MASAVLLISFRLTGSLSLLFDILLGGLVYLLMLRVLRAVREEDLDMIRNYLGDNVPWSVDILKNILL